MSPHPNKPVALFELIESTTRLKSQAAIARKIGVSRSLYGLWRTGRYTLPAWRIVQLADLFNLTPAKVMGALKTQYPEEILAEIAAEYLTPETN
jgi:transcriptional regulator with XRE-family HTH domain